MPTYEPSLRAVALMMTLASAQRDDPLDANVTCLRVGIALAFTHLEYTQALLRLSEKASGADVMRAIADMIIGRFPIEAVEV